MKDLNITIVGTGGSASYLLPMLIRTCYPINRLTLYDQDTLELRNLDRQLFNIDVVGLNKAEALAQTLHLEAHVKELIINKEWFTPGTRIPDDENFIFSCADNHPARKAVLAAVDAAANSFSIMEIPENPVAIILGNEYFDAEAYLYPPCLQGEPMDPRVMFPEILTATRGDPTGCQGLAQISDPQLAITNCQSAVHGMKLMWTWFHELYPEKDLEDVITILSNLPFYYRSSGFREEFLSSKTCLEQQKND